MKKESWQVSDEMLLFLYERGKHNEEPWIKHRNINILPTSPQNGFEGLLLQRLVSKRLVDKRRDDEFDLWGIGIGKLLRSASGQKQEYQISLQGLDYVIGELEDKNSHISQIATGEIASSISNFPKIIRSSVTAQTAQPAINAQIEAPASDRNVPLNHNEPEYLAVKSELQNSRQAILSINIDVAQEIARDTVVAALDAASVLWNSAELTIMQLKVGVLLAAERAAEFAKETAQALKIALLVEAIKAFIISKLGSGSI